VQASSGDVWFVEPVETYFNWDTLFFGYSLSQYDDEHSENENRWILLGKSLNETILVVVHTFKDNDGVEFVRIISARKATKREKQTYQKRCSK
jgi:hypothetical protein